jgi:hypothetical protein
MSKDFEQLELKDGIEDVQKLLSFKRLLHVFPDALKDNHPYRRGVLEHSSAEQLLPIPHLASVPMQSTIRVSRADEEVSGTV